MPYHYLAFNIPVISEIELPALLPVTDNSSEQNPVYVKLGTIPTDLINPGQQADSSAYCNASEMIYVVRNIIKFYISNGNSIIIEPINPNYRANLIYFYSNCLGAILFQRDLIPFHVSGVFTEPGKVVLFAAPSKTGKSTLALKLQELGYQPFTDDTAVLYIESGRVYAQASYPMMRLWQNTLNQQNLLQEADKQLLYEDDEMDKYGFPFHKNFSTAPAEVQQILFLRKEGDAIQLQPIKTIEAFKELADNVYRCHWIPFMQKSKTQFTLISSVLQTVPVALALRPEETESFEDFPQFIKKTLQNKTNLLSCTPINFINN